MSTPRLLWVCRVSAGSRIALRNQSRGLHSWTRFQSTKPSSVGRSGFGLGRLTVYTLTASGLVAGGALAYAVYDPVFKKQVDELVPGFARWADTTADLFGDRSGSVRPSRHDGGRSGVWGGAQEGRGRVGDSGRTANKSKGRRTDSDTTTTTTTASSEPSKPRDDLNESNLIEKENPANHHKEPQTVAVEAAGASEEREVQDKDVGGEASDGGETEGRGSEVGDVEEGEGGGGGAVEEGESEVLSSGEGEEEKEVKEDRGEVEKEERMEVEKVVGEVRGEVERMAGEVREEKVREVQEAQMADQHLNWLRDSAQVEEKLDQTLEEFLSQTTKVEEAQVSVLRSTREHSQLAKEITGHSVGEEGLDNVYETADAVHRAEEAVRASREALKTVVEGHKAVSQSLSELMDRAVDLGLKPKVMEVEERVRESARRLAEGATAVQQAEVERELLRDYHRQAQEDREQLQRELGRELPEGDSRQEALLVMLGRRVEVLKERLKGLEKEHQQRLTAALDQQKASLEQLAEKRLGWSLRDKEREVQQELDYQADKIHREYQSELREQLKRQADSHSRHLSDALNTQADQLAEKWSGELEVRLMEQESRYQKQLSLALSRLRGIEYVVNTITAAGNETKRQQGMRAACDSLHTALKSASGSTDPHEHFSLQREVATLRDAARDDPFILVVLDSLPAGAVSPGGGLQGEGGLRERFVKVKKVCRRVALVPERGGGLGAHALSYLQSALTVSWRFVGRVARSRAEDLDLDKLDTFEVLERADACMREGDLDLAIRYVNLLRGAPRRVARDWLRDARSYLETQQAVLLVSEYMAALNMSSPPAADGPN